MVCGAYPFLIEHIPTSIPASHPCLRPASPKQPRIPLLEKVR
jgi:hypothetical protein